MSYFEEKKQKWKRPIFDKNHGLSCLENFHFMHFFKTYFFLSRKHSFLSRIMPNSLFCLIWRKKKKTKKWPFFEKKKNHELAPLKYVEFFTFSKLYFFLSRKHSLLTRTMRKSFFCLILRKKPKVENGHFVTKIMD